MRIREITWLPQGHSVRPQLDACSDGLLGDGIMEVGWAAGGGGVRWRLPLVLSLEDRRLAAPGPVGSKVPHPGA